MFCLITILVSELPGLLSASPYYTAGSLGSPHIPLYPFQSAATTAPFAPSNDEAYINYMWWNQLSGTPVESQLSVVDAYDEDADSFNQWMLTGGADGGMPGGITPGSYQKYTQPSNPGAQYISYNLFSNPGGLESEYPAPGSTLFQPNNQFWFLQYLQGLERTEGSPIGNNMLRQYTYLLNSIAPNQKDPYANYWAYDNALNSLSTEKKRRRRRQIDPEEQAAQEAEEAQAAAEEAAAQEVEDALAAAAEAEAALDSEEAEAAIASEESQAAIEAAEYEEWYNNTYAPWYQAYMHQMAQYQQAMLAYEAQMAVSMVPSNPFGDVGFGNPFPFWSKNAYINSLHEDVTDQDPATTYSEEYGKWKCERESAIVDDVISEGESCWIPGTDTKKGFCSVVYLTVCDAGK